MVHEVRAQTVTEVAEETVPSDEGDAHAAAHSVTADQPGVTELSATRRARDQLPGSFVVSATALQTPRAALIRPPGPHLRHR